jgi:hypothetical protein
MPLNAALVTPAETPAACASAVMPATKLLKSPPQRAASADPPARQTMEATARAYLNMRENPWGTMHGRRRAIMPGNWIRVKAAKPRQNRSGQNRSGQNRSDCARD